MHSSTVSVGSSVSSWATYAICGGLGMQAMQRCGLPRSYGGGWGSDGGAGLAWELSTSKERVRRSTAGPMQHHTTRNPAMQVAEMATRHTSAARPCKPHTLQPTLRRCAEWMGCPSISTLPVSTERLSRSSAEPATMASRVVLPEPAGRGCSCWGAGQQVGHTPRLPTADQSTAQRPLNTPIAAAQSAQTPHPPPDGPQFAPEGPSTPTSSPLAATPLALFRICLKPGGSAAPPTATAAVTPASWAAGVAAARPQVKQRRSQPPR